MPGIVLGALHRFSLDYTRRRPEPFYSWRSSHREVRDLFQEHVAPLWRSGLRPDPGASTAQGFLAPCHSGNLAVGTQPALGAIRRLLLTVLPGFLAMSSRGPSPGEDTGELALVSQAWPGPSRLGLCKGRVGRSCLTPQALTLLGSPGLQYKVLALRSEGSKWTDGGAFAESLAPPHHTHTPHHMGPSPAGQSPAAQVVPSC